MNKMFRKRLLSYILVTGACVFGQSTFVMPAEPIVEVPGASPTEATPGDTTVLALGRVPLSLSLVARGGYDTNSRTSQSSQGSWFSSGAGILTYDLPGTVTQLKLDSGADISYYPDQNTSLTDNINTYVDAFLVHNVSERLRLSASAYATYRSEPDFRSNVGANSRQGNFFDTNSSLSVSYNWFQRFSTLTDDKFERVQYDSSSPIGNSLSRFQNTIGQSLRYDLHKGSTLVAEYRFQIVDYDTAPRDSLSHYLLLGLDEEFSPQLRCSLRGGASYRSFSQSGQNEIDPSFEGSVSYSGAHRSSVAWRTSYNVEEPSAEAVLSRTTFRTGLDFRYGFTARISGTVNAYYNHDDNRGTIPGAASSVGPGMPVSGFSEDSFDVSAGLGYVINSRFSFTLDFEHSEIISGNANRDYSRYRYSAGLTFTY